MSLRTIDLSGNRFGRLIAIRKVRKDKHGSWLWECKCDCGARKIINGTSLRRGLTRSCGCLKSELTRERNRKTNRYENAVDGSIVGYTEEGEPFFIDAEDFDKVKQFYWRKTPNGYLYTKENRRMILLHRFVMNLWFSPRPRLDHKNLLKHDCRKANLRICDASLNAANTSKGKPDTSSKYKGVYWSKDRGMWIAQIRVDYKAYNLGGYAREEDAAKAYNEAAKKHFGKFARLNVV